MINEIGKRQQNLLQQCIC